MESATKSYRSTTNLALARGHHLAWLPNVTRWCHLILSPANDQRLQRNTGNLQGVPCIKVTSCYSRGKDSCIYRGEITPGKLTDKAVQRGYDSIFTYGRGPPCPQRTRTKTDDHHHKCNQQKTENNNTHHTEVMLLRTIGFRVVNPRVLATSKLDKNVIWGYLYRCLSQTSLLLW